MDGGRAGFYLLLVYSLFVMSYSELSDVEFKESEKTVIEQFGQVSIVVKRTNAKSNSPAVNVALEVASSSTLQASEYSIPSPFQVSFGIGDSEASVDVTLKDDGLDEPAEETLVVQFTANPTLYTPKNVLTTTIKVKDNDVSVFNFESTIYSTKENQDLVITMNRRKPIGEIPITVRFAHYHLTTEAADLGTVPTSVDFAAGEATKTFTVPIIDDQIDEANETFSLVLNTFGNEYGISYPLKITVTIEDDDESIVEFVDVAKSFDEGDSSVTIQLRRTNIESNSPAVSVTLNTTEGTAGQGYDFNSTKLMTVNFAEGIGTALATIDILEDDLDEIDETFSLTVVESATVKKGGQGSLEVTITDNDKSIVEFVDTTKAFDEGDGTVTIKLRRTNFDSNSPAVSVTLSTTEGTASDGDDFDSAKFTTVNFVEGSETASTTIDILEDNLDEIDETFSLTIVESATVKKGGQGTLEITITDNDKSATVKKGGQGTLKVTISDKDSPVIIKQKPSLADCANVVSPGIIAVIVTLAVLLLLFLVLSIVLLFRLKRRTNHPKT